MSDRFKFRVWDIKNRDMIEINSLYFFECEGIETIEDNGFTKGHFNDYYIMQCTGLKDKNGTLIFEGDVLKDVRGALVSVGVIMWRNEYAQFTKNGWDLPSFIDRHCEVIGNIHENPDLLEQ